MSHIPFRLSLPCIFLFTVAMLVIYGHTTSSSDLDLRVLLTPSDCHVPCFMGIRLGETTLEAGVKQLEASPMVQSIDSDLPPSNDPVLPSRYDLKFVDTLGSMQDAQVQFSTERKSGIIDGIELLDDGLQLKNIILSFGQPTSVILDNRSHNRMLTYVAFYPQYQMYVHAVLTLCSPDLGTFWDTQQSVLVGIDNTSKYTEERSDYSQAADQSDQGWLTTFNDIKNAICT